MAGSLWPVPSGRDSIIIYNTIFIYIQWSPFITTTKRVSCNRSSY